MIKREKRYEIPPGEYQIWTNGSNPECLGDFELRRLSSGINPLSNQDSSQNESPIFSQIKDKDGRTYSIHRMKGDKTYEIMTEDRRYCSPIGKFSFRGYNLLFIERPNDRPAKKN